MGEVDGKAERALTTLGSLKFERRLVIDMKDGANFGFNSAALPPQARKEIDGFLSDLKGDVAGGENAVFLVAGHTDNAGSEDVNYELGKRRADAVSRYLVTQKKMDPLRVVTVSYGKMLRSPIIIAVTGGQRTGVLKSCRSEAINSNTAATLAPQQQEQKSSQASPMANRRHAVTDTGEMRFGARGKGQLKGSAFFYWYKRSM